MKIRQLHINRFGHFNEYDLVIPGDGLQVLYGPNEAGKTTLLEFLRGLIFDFPARTPYDFVGQSDLAGVATLQLNDGRTVELRRRKGNKDKIAIKIDGQPTDLTEAGWLRLLDEADRGLFESIFAFGLDQLSQGEESLKHESLRSALFGGSLGGVTSPDKVVAELTRQSADLFKSGGSKPSINAALADLKRLAKEIKAGSLRPDEYHEAEVNVTKTAQCAQALHQQVDQLRRELVKIEKRLRAWPKWWDLRQRRDARAGLGLSPSIPTDARHRFLVIAKELKALAGEQANCVDGIRQAKEGLAALQLDPSAVSYRAEIKSCLELRKSFLDAKLDLPERQRQRESLRLLIERELAEFRPGWTHDNLRAFSVDLATRNQIDRLSEERGTRMNARMTLLAKSEGDRENLERAREDLAQIGSPRDVTLIAAVLADEAEYVANRKRLDGTRGEMTRLERTVTTHVSKLTPPLTATTSLPLALPVPRAETIASFDAEFSEIRTALQTASTTIDDDEAQQRELENELAVGTPGHDVPSLDELASVRKRRDTGWSLIRRQYIDSEQSDTGVAEWLAGDAGIPLPDIYEQSVRIADHTADRIYENANEVADRENKRRQIATLEARLNQKRQRLSELSRQQAELQACWRTLWQPCGFEPLTPDAMLSWLKDHEALCATAAQRDELTAEQSRLGERLEVFEQRLRAASGLGDEDVAGLLASARGMVNSAKEQQTRVSDLEREKRRLEKQLTKYDAELQTLASQETAANVDWRSVLDRLNFPGEWHPQLTREIIDKLNTTRVRLDALPGEEDRIAAICTRIEEFDKRARVLCEVVNAELLHDPPELAIKKLDDQVERALDAQRKHDGLSEQLTTARTQLESLHRSRSQQDSELECLFAQACAKTETEFLEVVGRAESIAQLDMEIGQLTGEVDLIRAGDNLDEFEQSMLASELTLLQAENRDLREKLTAAEAERKDADGNEALARDALKRLDGSDGVALRSEELCRKRALLVAEVDRYMPLVYARHLLTAAVNRFEKENQPEMIATISGLIAQMTDGKYVEVDRAVGGKQQMLLRRDNGVERTPDQLSTGTREQLYLAIRLAYVLHYCKQHEPLPIVMDDVLANFDDRRSELTLSALAGIAQSVQVLFFTCHPHIVGIARQVVPGITPIELRSGAKAEMRAQSAAASLTR